MRRSSRLALLILSLAACDGRPPPHPATAAALLAPAHGPVQVLRLERLHGEHWRVRFGTSSGDATARLRHADGAWRLDDPTSMRERLRFL